MQNSVSDNTRRPLFVKNLWLNVLFLLTNNNIILWSIDTFELLLGLRRGLTLQLLNTGDDSHNHKFASEHVSEQCAERGEICVELWALLSRAAAGGHEWRIGGSRPLLEFWFDVQWDRLYRRTHRSDPTHFSTISWGVFRGSMDTSCTVVTVYLFKHDLTV